MSTESCQTSENGSKPKRRRALAIPLPAHLSSLSSCSRLLRKLSTSLAEITSLPQVTPLINRLAKRIQLTREDILEHLALCADDDIRAFLQTYNRPDIPDDLRHSFPYELYCAATKDKNGVPLSPNRLLEVTVAMIVRANTQLSAAIASAFHPEIVEATVGYALTQEGISDRNALHKAVGFTPTPKSAQTTIQISNAATAQAAASAQAPVAAPPPELTIRTLVDRFNDARGLRTPQLPAENPHEYAPEFIAPSEDGLPDEDLVSERVPVMSPVGALARRMHEEREMEE